jgi:hypothetical protein
VNFSVALFLSALNVSDPVFRLSDASRFAAILNPFDCDVRPGRKSARDYFNGQKDAEDPAVVSTLDVARQKKT